MPSLGTTALDVATGLSAITRVGALEAQLATAFEALGFDSYGFGDLPRPGSEDDIVMYINHWPDGWVDSYFDEGIAEIDYLLPETLRRRAPFTWAEADRRHGDSPGAPKVQDAVRQFGWSDGLVIPFHRPFHRPSGPAGLISLAARKLDQSPRERAAARM